MEKVFIICHLQNLSISSGRDITPQLLHVFVRDLYRRQANWEQNLVRPSVN